MGASHVVLYTIDQCARRAAVRQAAGSVAPETLGDDDARALFSRPLSLDFAVSSKQGYNVHVGGAGKIVAEPGKPTLPGATD